jgi:dUTPase
MTDFIKGYTDDAAIDIVMPKDGSILPGFHKIPLSVKYTPRRGEVAIIVPRTRTLDAGIFVPVGLIDANYTGTLSVWLFNCSGLTYKYKAGDRLFGIVNLKLAPDRVHCKYVNLTTVRGTNKNSTGGQ